MINLVNVTKKFRLPNQEVISVLEGIELYVRQGEIVAIMGPSGSGKTTLLSIAGLIEAADSGQVVIDGKTVDNLSDKQASRIRGELFGFVFQQFHLLPRRSAQQNVIAPILQGSRQEISERFERARQLLCAVGLQGRMEQPSEALSGGEQQRVAIARALARQPSYILADEPTGSLDSETGEHVLALLMHAVREQGCGMLLSTHDQRVAMHADRVLIMKDGVLKEGASP